jgi:Glycosyltransferase family 87
MSRRFPGPLPEQGRGGGRVAARRLRQRLLVIFLLAMLIPYTRQVLTSPTTGQDFRAFFAAATVVAERGNPYDWPALARVEDRLYNAPQHVKPGDPAFYEFLAFPEGPWLAFALLPLTPLPWQLADVIYASILLLLLAGSSALFFRLLGWPPRRILAGAACASLSAIGFINLFMGQVSVIVFAGFITAWWLARRGQGWWAGVVLVLIWLKPNIGLPLPLVVLLLEPRAASRLIGGFVAASAVAFFAATIALGSAFLDWPLQIPKMWQAVQGIQPDIASVESFYYPGLSGWAKSVALLITLTGAVAYAVWALRRASDPLSRGLSLLLIWLAFMPFVQSYDMVLLLPVVAVLLGADLEGWADPRVEVTLWAFVILPLGYFLGFRLGYFNGVTAIPVTMLLLSWHTRLASPPMAVTPAVAA